MSQNYTIEREEGKKDGDEEEGKLEANKPKYLQ